MFVEIGKNDNNWKYIFTVSFCASLVAIQSVYLHLVVIMHEQFRKELINCSNVIFFLSYIKTEQLFSKVLCHEINNNKNNFEVGLSKVIIL